MFERLMALLTALAVIAACATCYVIWLQVRGMKTDQRAWVGFDEIESWNLAVDQPFVITIPLRNVGKTPARNVSAGIQVTDLPPGQKPDIDKLVGEVLGPPNAIMLPGQVLKMHADLRRPDGPLTADDVSRIRSGQAIIYAVGKVGYTDVFGFDHWTRYCSMSQLSWLEGIKFRQCPEGNEIDRNEQ